MFFLRTLLAYINDRDVYGHSLRTQKDSKDRRQSLSRASTNKPSS